jgi:general secretion pathway protein C
LASATTWIDELKSVQGLTRLFADRGAQLIALVLLVALGLDSALILARAVGHKPDLPAPKLITGPAVARARTNPTLQLASIVNAHLFGSAAAATSGKDAPATSMPLILAGVIADSDPGKGQAIIGENAAAGKRYAVGDALPGGAHLHAVYGDRVLLERNSGLETLMLPRTPMAEKTMTAAPIAAAGPRQATTRESATLLAGMVRIQPVFAQGKLSGYRIFPAGGHGTKAFAQLGLKSGDLIQAVNGTALDDAARAMEVLQTLSSSAAATVTVVREGQGQEVNLNLASLNIESDSGDNAPGAPGQGAEQPGAVGAPGGRVRPGANPILGTAPGTDAPAAPTGGASSGNAIERDR